VKPQPSHDSFRPSATLAALQQRAALLRTLRRFFDERGFFEVETPLLAPEIIPELYIEPIRTADGGKMSAARYTIRNSRSSNGTESATTCRPALIYWTNLSHRY
jgi:hypothetical protein